MPNPMNLSFPTGIPNANPFRRDKSFSSVFPQIIRVNCVMKSEVSPVSSFKKTTKDDKIKKVLEVFGGGEVLNS